MESLDYPLYCLDFETLGLAIPPFDGTRPYQKIPFQFSIHFVPSLKAAPKSHSYLADGRDNFLPDVLKALSVIGPTGTVLSYNMSFERQVLKSLAEIYPKEKTWIENLTLRMKDLIEPFRTFSYYHPDQCGSCSFKDVLPSLTGRTYAEMEIQEGETASLRYYQTHFCDCDEGEKQEVRKALLEYCNLDTEGMVEILKELERMY